MSSRRARLRLVLRERRASVEQALLNRAFRANKSTLDNVLTRIVASQVPRVAPEVGRSKAVDPIDDGRDTPRSTGPSR